MPVEHPVMSTALETGFAMLGSFPPLQERPGPLEDAIEIDTGRQRTEGEAVVVRETRGHERVRHRRIAVADEERGFEGERHALHQPPGTRLDRAEVAQLVAHAR